jgi:hypothetical protein
MMTSTVDRTRMGNMDKTGNDWVGAGIISAIAVVCCVLFFWWTSRIGESADVARIMLVRALIAVVVWALAIFSNRWKIGLPVCLELGVLMLISAGAFGLGRIWSDAGVSALVPLNVGTLSSLMFLSGACIAAIAVHMTLRMIRIRGLSEEVQQNR